MCGITGYYAYQSTLPSKNILHSFTDSLSHRGPDGRGDYFSPTTSLYFGHRRLKILDLSAKGTQPLSYINQRFWITYNGEIYNFLELKTELEQKGYIFKSDTDTEVILASYLEWGPSCLNRFNGMWSFAIWDEKEKKLFLARDRFGVKPLLYYLDKKVLAFASELKAFFSLPLNLSFDYQQISNAISHPSLFEARKESLVENIYKLPAGHYALFDAFSSLKIVKWWDTMDHVSPCKAAFSEQTAEFLSLFTDACKVRMRSDAPLATALSGGLDSSSVFSMIHHLLKNRNSISRAPIDCNSAYVAIYSNSQHNEYKYAKELVEELNAPHQPFEIKSDHLISLFDQVLYSLENIFDLPVGPWLLYKQYKKNGHKISLDGHGADELLGGYFHHIQTALFKSCFPIFRKKTFQDLFQILQKYYENSQQKTSIYSGLKAPVLSYLNSSSPFSGLMKILLTLKKKIKPSFSPMDCLQISPNIFLLPNRSRLDDLLFFDFHQGTLPAILRNFDRCSMAHGVEIRAPFLDWRLVTYAFSLPTESKIANGYTKRILREAVKGIVPDSIRLRKSKIGFANPLKDWFQKPLSTFLLDSVNSQEFIESPVWEGKKIRNDLAKAYNNKEFSKFQRYWEFLQAHRLMALLKNQKNHSFQ